MKKNGFTPWSEVLLEDALRCQRAACFTLGCLEREHRLNAQALMGFWMRASLAWWSPLLPPAARPPDPLARAVPSATDPPEAP